MQEIKENCYKGTRILLGNLKRDITNIMIERLKIADYMEISMPIINTVDIFAEKAVGIENAHMMYRFTDACSRMLCLAPEYTSIIMNLKDTFKHQKDVRLFYVQECFRGEKPQAGRYRQFTQLGVEIINPTKDYNMPELAIKLIHLTSDYTSTINDFDIHYDVDRGLDYYTPDSGFEISCNKLGAQKQICGGGAYEGGIGFAIGIDRLLLLHQQE